MNKKSLRQKCIKLVFIFFILVLIACQLTSPPGEPEKLVESDENNSRAESVMKAGLPYYTGFENGLDQYWTTYSSTTDGRIEATSDYNDPAVEGEQHLLMACKVKRRFKNLNAAMLHLDLSGYTDVSLTFSYKHFYDEVHSKDGIYFSDDGGRTFVKVSILRGGDYDQPSNQWAKVIMSLSGKALANGLSLTDNFVIKFQQYGNHRAPYDGYAFDKIIVESEKASIPYSTGFEDGLEGCWDLRSNYWKSARVEISEDYGPAEGFKHLIMDADTYCAGNSAWLNINLLNQTDITLSFKWKYFGAYTHHSDGIFISDDKGRNFVKIFSFREDYPDLPSDQWQATQLDLDDLAQVKGINFNSDFVIKFQVFTCYLIPKRGYAFDSIAVN